MLADIDSLLLDDLLAAELGAIRAESLVLSFRGVAPLLEERLVTIGSPVLLLNDEVRGSAQVGVAGLVAHHLDLAFDFFVLELVGVFADVVEDLAPLDILLGPPGDVVIGLLLLETLEDDLVLAGDFHKFAFARLAVEALFEKEGGLATLAVHRDCLRLLHGGALHGRQVRVRVRDPLWVLQNIRHLLQ